MKAKILSLFVLFVFSAFPLFAQEGEPFVKHYTETDVKVKSGDVTLAGTLTMPAETKGPVGAALLISGSGAQDRDENIFGYKPFAEIAHALAEAGIASLRLDDRGVGVSDKGSGVATFETRVKDAWAAVEWLRADPRIDREFVSLIGHSEGGAIAFTVAAEHPDEIFAIVALATPAVKGKDLMVRQNELLLSALGQMLTPDVHDALAAIFGAVETGDKAKITEAVHANGPKAGMLPQTYEMQIQALSDPAYVEMIQRDYGAMLGRVKCPVLAICGEWDFQVDPDTNLLAVKRAIPDAQIIKPDCTNHLMQRTETRDESLQYGRAASRPFSPDVMRMIVDFLR